MRRKKWFAALLAFVIAAVMLPMSAFAQGAVSRAPEDETVVEFEDEAFEKLLKEQLKIADGSDITAEDMKKLTYLTIGSTSGVEDIAGIQYAVNLQTLDIDGDVSGLHQLQSLSGLVRLTINSNNFLDNIAELGSKPNLTLLDISSCDQLESLHGLTGEIIRCFRNWTVLIATN